MAKRLEPRPLRFPALLPKRGVSVFPDEEEQQPTMPDGYARVLAPMNLLAAVFILAAAILGVLNKTSFGMKIFAVGGLALVSIAVVGLPFVLRAFRTWRM